MDMLKDKDKKIMKELGLNKNNNNNHGQIEYSFNISTIHNLIKSNDRKFIISYVVILLFFLILFIFKDFNLKQRINNISNTHNVVSQLAANKAIKQNDLNDYTKFIPNIDDTYIKKWFKEYYNDNIAFFNNLPSIFTTTPDNNTLQYKLNDYTKIGLLILCALMVSYYIIVLIIQNLYAKIYKVIEHNPNNNPYDNPIFITKIKNKVSAEVRKKAGILWGEILVFIITLIYIKKYYSAPKKTTAFILLFLVIMLLSSINNMSKNLNLLKIGAKKYLDIKDYSFIDSLTSELFIIYSFIFLIYCFIFGYAFYNIIFVKHSKMIKLLFFVILVFCGYIFIYISNYVFLKCYNESCDILITTNVNGMVESSLSNNKVSNIYGALVKYNYPCVKV